MTITTIGTVEGNGYRHRCDQCGMNRIVPGERFRHICPQEPCSTCEKSLPSLLTQAGNLAMAGVDAVASGFKLRSSEEQAACLAICRDCPLYQDGRCTECGCFVAAKVKLFSQKCPLEKW